MQSVAHEGPAAQMMFAACSVYFDCAYIITHTKSGVNTYFAAREAFMKTAA